MSALRPNFIVLAIVAVVVAISYGFGFAQSARDRDITVESGSQGGGAIRPSVLGRVYAVVAGIDHYESRHIPRLSFAVSDARAVATRIVPKMLGTSHASTVLLGPAASKSSILAALNNLAGVADAADSVLIYFSMHGVLEANSQAAYLVPYDTEPGNIVGSAIAIAALRDSVNRVRARKVFVFVDSCFSGAVIGGWGETGRSYNYGHKTRLSVDSSQRFFADITNRRGHFVLSAARATERALELPDLGHGLFTYFLLRGFAGEAANPTTHYVTISTLHEYVSRNVIEFAQAIGREQTPMFDGQFDGQPAVLTIAERPGTPDRRGLAELAAEVRRSLLSSRLIIRGNGLDMLELYVEGEQKWSGRDTRKEYRIGPESFSTGSKAVRVRLVASPTQTGRARAERPIVLRQGEEVDLTIESTPIASTPRSPSPSPERRILGPLF